MADAPLTPEKPKHVQEVEMLLLAFVLESDFDRLAERAAPLYERGTGDGEEARELAACPSYRLFSLAYACGFRAATKEYERLARAAAAAQGEPDGARFN